MADMRTKIAETGNTPGNFDASSMRTRDASDATTAVGLHGESMHGGMNNMSGMGGLSPQQFERLLSSMRSGPDPSSIPPSGLGNPGPLGLSAFGLTTFVLSVFNTGHFIEPTLVGVVLPLALIYGGIGQFAAGMWEYRTNNTFGATAFTSYGCFWVSLAAFLYYIEPGLDAAVASNALGLFLLAWLLFTCSMLVASFRISTSVFLIFLLLSLTFLLLTIGALDNSTRCTHAGGWLGLLTAAASWYGATAVNINSAYGRTILPVGVGGIGYRGRDVAPHAVPAQTMRV